LGRGSYERRRLGDREDYQNDGYVQHFLTELEEILLRIPRSRKDCHQSIGGLSEAISFD
jgi:hypothetical protein